LNFKVSNAHYPIVEMSRILRQTENMNFFAVML